ncbi:Type 4 prepilin-like proteins leader peptide-processing enzyme [Streptococcus constellatus]|uniref:Type 4 prepilin-like proteins leader peptide-processing enzyme n=1 Tax=Streptococcus constellatus TaxID=76860 RepID=A0A564TAE3_STRCV|nr:A24 family peptidase [Streptococcus constellatus]VUW94606.1 Type 4 prepilin-like proteins leader peptide-processing enzyme [Streptococcus gordonii]VUX04395.1 Type 4 prepilin-like proteins leader peptide-processing enzyme [Streptococcus constellatus]
MIHFYFFLVGSIVASFLELVVDRFPGQSIIGPSSHCNACEQKLAPRDLIPVLSQLINRLRCRFCGSKIPIRYLVLEIAIGFLFLATSMGYLNIGQLVLLVMGVTLSLYDQREQEYPLLVWLFFHFLLLFLTNFNLLMTIFLALGILAHFVDLRIGAGDFLFLASCSTIFKLTEILWLIQIASLVGLCLFGLKKKKDRLAFVPCLLIGVIVLLLYELLLQ